MLPKPFQHAWMDTDIGVFRDQVRRYIERELSPHVPTWRAQGYVPRETWRGFGEHGFLLPEMDEQWGGGGGNLAYQLVVQEELTRAEIHAITSVHTITAHYIDTYGTPEQKQRWLPRLCSGEMLAGIAMTEPSVGSDLKAMQTRARLDGDHYVINGSKTFIVNFHAKLTRHFHLKLTHPLA